MQAEEILRIAPAQAASLFPGDADAVVKSFRKLLKTWHPDVCKDPRAGDVVRHITTLRDRLLDAPAIQPGVIVELADGRKVRVKALRSRPFDAGTIHVAARSVAYVVAGAEDRTPAFDFPDRRMREEMERFLPHPKRSDPTDDGALMVYERTEDQFLLADVLATVGVLPPTHVAWIVSGMLNVANFLGFSKVGHGGISPETLLVSPKYHSIALTGPMLFATRLGERPAALPERTLDAIPRLVAKGVPMTPEVDLELVRLTAMECLGVRSPAQLCGIPGLPPEFADWLSSSPRSAALEDYASWEQARDKGFGPRRFIPWDLPPDRIYPA